MLSLICTIALVLLAVAAMACIWLATERRALQQNCERLQQKGLELESRNEALQEAQRTLEKDKAVALETQQGIHKMFEQAQSQLREAFGALAGDALKKSSEQFLQLAQKTFEGEQKEATAQLERQKLAIKGLVDPIREKLDKYNQTVREIEKARQQSYGSLRQQLGMMVEDQRRLRDETGNLVKALRRPEVRGRWGEMQLKRVAELAGMIEHCDFSEQVHIKTDDGALKPDMLVHLPADRQIVVDAKTPIDAFISAVECDSESLRQKHFHQHLEHIETKVRALAGKGYQSQFERSPDFVVLFIPGESFLQPAVNEKPDLLESAIQKGVLIATPTTLIALLRAVAIGWREQRVAENARRISELGQELHERVATATGHIDKLGQSLERAVGSFNEFVGSFENRVVVSARKFKELGADSAKELPDEGQIKQIDLIPRTVKLAESIQAGNSKDS